MLVGPPGTGKTSVAECIARALYGKMWRKSFQEINSSDERRIDVVRGMIKRLSKIRGRRILFLDEADNLTSDAQQALRRTMEQSKGTIFILSGNREWKFIDAIKSRCAKFNFKRLKDEVIMRRVLEVCQAEGIEISSDSKKGFLALVESARGDLRKALNGLEKIIGEGKRITANEVISLTKPKVAGEALKVAISGDFERAKEMLEDSYINSSFSVDSVTNELYEAIGELKDRKVKIRLYAKLSETEKNCRIGSNPLIQLVGFIAYSWVIPHMKEGCPALNGVK